MKMPKYLHQLFVFYKEGFSNMTVGKTLWLLVIIKLFVIFVVLRLLFFPNYLNTNFHDNKSKADHVREELISKKVL